MTTRAKQDMPIQICQALAIFFVVVFHAHKLLSGAGLSHEGHAWFLRPLGFILIPLFFLTSGMSMSRASRMQSGNFVRSRISSYLWLYLLWSLIYFLTSAGRVLRGDVAVVDWLQTGFESVVFPTGTLWFFHHLIVFIILMKLLQGYNRTTILLNIFAAQVISSLTDAELTTRFLGLMLFFAAGYLYRAEISKLLGVLCRSCGFIALTAFIAADLTLFTWNADFSNHQQNPLISDIMSVLGIIWLVQIAHLLARTRLGDVLRAMGSKTLPIYLMHWMVLLLIFKLAQPLAPYLDSYVTTIASPWVLGAISIVICIKLSRVLGHRAGLFVAPRWFSEAAGAQICTALRQGRRFRATVSGLLRA